MSNFRSYLHLRYKVATLAVVALAWCIYLGAPAAWRIQGVATRGHEGPFFDLYGTLCTSDVQASGHDSYESNPLDPAKRRNVYSTWWLLLARLGVTRADCPWLGLVLCLLVAVAAIQLAAPCSWREVFTTVMVLCSPALLFAVNRANNDLFIFLVLSAAVLTLRDPEGRWRWLGAALIGLAAVLKYYPLAAVVVVFGARSRRRWMAECCVVAAMICIGAQSWGPAMATISSQRTTYILGNLLGFGCGELMAIARLPFPQVLGCIVLLLAGAGMFYWRMSLNKGRSANEILSADTVMGSSVLLACFLLGCTYSYKLVFALWLLPYVLREGQRSWSRTLIILALFSSLWLEGLAMALENGLSAGIVNIWVLSAGVATRCCEWVLMLCLGWLLVGHVTAELRRLMGSKKPHLVSAA